MTLPLAVVALVMAVAFVPSHVHETTDAVDNLGGILSVVMISALVLAINFAAVPNAAALAIGLGAIALAGSSRSSSGSDGRRTPSTTCTSPGDGSSGWPRAPASSSSVR